MKTIRIASLALLTTAPLSGQVNTDTVRAGRFDYGKMWTFENAPARYFTEAYGFDANAAWFERARGAALRIPGCSAAFVSPRGLVVTNHHCIRDAVVQLSKPGENLDDNGFYAKTLQEERRIPNYYVDQLIAVEDVSAEILAAIDRATDDAGRRTARTQAISAVRDRMMRAANDPLITVQVVPLYNGGRYSAYTFRRYTDVRLVAAAELQMGFFGGDPDNFTYPRYALDFGFLRVYGPDGQPINNTQYFNWSETGPQEGEVVFVIGNPGTTNRLSTIAQLEFRRDVLLPAQARVFDARIQALWEFYREDEKTANELDVRGLVFGLSNSWKQYVGQIDALNTPVIVAKKRAAERQLRDSINAKPALRQAYGTAIDRIAAIQPRNRELAPYFNAFTLWGNGSYESAVLRRVIAVWQGLQAIQRGGVPADTINAMQQRILQIRDLPKGLERRLLIARLKDLATLPANDPIRIAALGSMTPEAAADRLMTESVFSTAQRTAAAMTGMSDPNDPAMLIVNATMPRFSEYATRQQQNATEEADLAQQLGRARFEIYGTAVPPDGTGSPRITDGVVRGYEYNGTTAPAHTTFFGMYDRFYAHGPDTDWNLPKRWLPVPAGLDLNTALNFISTADTYGGNSGSPAVTQDLALVGLNFDRNMEGLSRNFIYLPERGRNIMVDVRAIREALDDVYDADRIVLEVLTHKMYATEREADAAARPRR
ncbi:MAG: S46 family peptidase [Gemmatimonadota bacterium]